MMLAPSIAPDRNFSDAWPGGNTFRKEASGRRRRDVRASRKEKARPKGAQSTGVEKT
jgi:hypothetical protein